MNSFLHSSLDWFAYMDAWGVRLMVRDGFSCFVVAGFCWLISDEGASLV